MTDLVAGDDGGAPGGNRLEAYTQKFRQRGLARIERAFSNVFTFRRERRPRIDVLALPPRRQQVVLRFVEREFDFARDASSRDEGAGWSACSAPTRAITAST